MLLCAFTPYNVKCEQSTVSCLLRLRREDGASVVRLRWYGPRSLKPDQKIYVEKKVHREPWTEEPGYKVTSLH